MGLLQRLKPGSLPGTRLLLAALIWTAVGAVLFVMGARWLVAAGATWAIAGGLVALLLGLVKGGLLLRTRARANAERIVAAGEARCVGGVFSWAMWLFVASMAVAGLLLRLSPLPRTYLGVIYAAVGVALLRGSAETWSWWARHRS